MALRVMQLKGDAANVEERRIVERQVAHLSRLVDDLLDVSRITQGKIELRRERVDLRGVVVKALELTLPMFERRTRAIELDLAPDALRRLRRRGAPRAGRLEPAHQRREVHAGPGRGAAAARRARRHGARSS